jgi:hypothetical protein
MDTQTAFLITVGQPEIDGIMADEFEETLIYVGRLIERLNTNENFIGKYIYVTEYLLSENGTFIKQDGLFNNKYLIEK